MAATATNKQLQFNSDVLINANEKCGSGYDPAIWEFQIKELETGNMYPCYYYGD